MLRQFKTAVGLWGPFGLKVRLEKTVWSYSNHFASVGSQDSSMNFLTDNAQQCGIAKQFETLQGTETHSFQEYVFQKVELKVSLSM